MSALIIQSCILSSSHLQIYLSTNTWANRGSQTCFIWNRYIVFKFVLMFEFMFCRFMKMKIWTQRSEKSEHLNWHNFGILDWDCEADCDRKQLQFVKFYELGPRCCRTSVRFLLFWVLWLRISGPTQESFLIKCKRLFEQGSFFAVVSPRSAHSLNIIEYLCWISASIGLK